MALPDSAMSRRTAEQASNNFLKTIFIDRKILYNLPVKNSKRGLYMKKIRLFCSIGLMIFGLLTVILFIACYLNGADMYQYSPVLFLAVAIALQGSKGIIEYKLQLKQLIENEHETENDKRSMKLLYNLISGAIWCLLAWTVVWIIFEKIAWAIFSLLML